MKITLNTFTVLSLLFIGVIIGFTMDDENVTIAALQQEVQQFENYIPAHETLNPEVSKATVGWHVYHSLLTVNEVYAALQQSNPGAYKNRFNPRRAMMFTMNKIPRGRAQSPKVVLPPQRFTQNDLLLQLQKARENLSIIDSLPENAFFNHPYVGSLNREQAKKFLWIHTRHHLGIIRDIVGE